MSAISKVIRVLKKACGVYYRHGRAITTAESKRRNISINAIKCRSRNDDVGYGQWASQCRQHTLAALRASNAAGIRGCAAYANGISSVNLVARMK